MWLRCQPLETDDGYRIQAKVMPPERRSKPATDYFLRSIDHSTEVFYQTRFCVEISLNTNFQWDLFRIAEFP